MTDITVYIPARNAEPYFQTAIDSILNQSYNNFNLLLVVSESEDNTVEIALSQDDERVSVIHADNADWIEAPNIALDTIETKYIARMDADDIAYKDRLERQINILEEGYDIVGECFKHTDRIHATGVDKRICSCDKPWQFMHPSIAHRNTDIRYDKRFTYNEERDFFNRLSLRGRRFKYLQNLIKHREHSNSISSSVEPKKTTETANRLHEMRTRSIGDILGEYDSVGLVVPTVNSGDILISKGIQSVANVVWCRERPYPDADVICINGGANIIGRWQFGRSALYDSVSMDVDVIVAPQSYMLDEVDLPDVTYCARDNRSYENICSITGKEQVLTEDAAFEYSPDVNYDKSGVLNAFRTDGMNIVGIPDDNWDIAFESFEVYEEEVASAELVSTDRLHVAIMSHLTETKCELYKHSWWKNRAVYNYSLKDSPYVTWRNEQ